MRRFAKPLSRTKTGTRGSNPLLSAREQVNGRQEQVTRRRRQLTCSPAHLLALVLLLLLLPACSSRSLTIKSNPSGADVFLDGDYAGVTPVTVPFVYGGHRDILVYKRAT